MEKRFRREKNLSRRNPKKHHEQIHHIKESTETKSEISEEASPLEHISHTYAKIQSGGLFRDTILLGLVLAVLLLAAAWVLPRIFSVHIDVASIVRGFIPQTLG